MNVSLPPDAPLPLRQRSYRYAYMRRAYKNVRRIAAGWSPPAIPPTITLYNFTDHLTDAEHAAYRAGDPPPPASDDPLRG